MDDIESFLAVHANIEKTFMRIWATGFRMTSQHKHLKNTKFGAHILYLWNIYDIFGKLHTIGVNKWGIDYARLYYEYNKKVEK